MLVDSNALGLPARSKLLGHFQRLLERLHKLVSGSGATPEVRCAGETSNRLAIWDRREGAGCQFNLDSAAQHAIGWCQIEIDERACVETRQDWLRGCFDGIGQD